MENQGNLAAVDDAVGVSARGFVRASIDLAWTPLTGDAVEFEAATHKDATFRAIEGHPMEDIDGTGVTSASTAGAWLFNVQGIARLRARASAIGATPIAVKILAE